MLNFYLDESFLDDTIPVLTTRMNDRLKSIYNKNIVIKLKISRKCKWSLDYLKLLKTIFL